MDSDEEDRVGVNRTTVRDYLYRRIQYHGRLDNPSVDREGLSKELSRVWVEMGASLFTE
jgi:hypothetical protein